MSKMKKIKRMIRPDNPSVPRRKAIAAVILAACFMTAGVRPPEQTAVFSSACTSHAASLPGGVSAQLHAQAAAEEQAEEAADKQSGDPVGEALTDTDPETEWSIPEEDEDFSDFHLDLEYIDAYGEEYCSDIIFYGDSRVVGMSYTIGGDHYVGKEGAGYDWMQGEGMSYLTSQMNENPDSDIVFCFGVNDPGNIDQYIRFFQSMVETYPERRFWFLSVNPVYDGISASHGYNARNEQIDTFNARLEEAFPDRYIDSGSYLKEYGYNAQDGVHYDGDTYFAIQNFCWRAITQKIEEEEQETEGTPSMTSTGSQ